MNTSLLFHDVPHLKTMRGLRRFPDMYFSYGRKTVFHQHFLQHYSIHKRRIQSQVYDEVLLQPAFTCSKLTIETLEQGVKYVQS